MDTTNFFGRNTFVSFVGVVEDRDDPLKLKRVRVRCYGFHDDDKILVPTSSLPWATVTNGVFGSLTHHEGSWVWGFFLDGIDSQEPVVVGMFPGIPSSERDTQIGFNDPREDVSGYPRRVASVDVSGVDPVYTEEDASGYPKSLNEPDTHRLARNENVEGVPQMSIKESLNQVSTPVAGGGVFSEPVSPYAAVYPFNDVIESESGHLHEVDDTPGAERINVQHRTGSFEEYHPDGSLVKKIVSDCYQYIMGTWREFVRGDKHVTVGGGQKVLINSSVGANHCEVEIGAGGNVIVNVLDGDVDLTCNNLTATVNGTATVDATGNVNILSDADINITATGNVNITGATVNLN